MRPKDQKVDTDVCVLQDTRHSIGEELDRCEEELDREERLGGRGRRSATEDFRDTLSGYK